MIPRCCWFRCPGGTLFRHLHQLRRDVTAFFPAAHEGSTSTRPRGGRARRRTFVVCLAIFVTSVVTSPSPLRPHWQARLQHAPGVDAREGTSLSAALMLYTLLSALLRLCPRAPHCTTTSVSHAHQWLGHPSDRASDPLHAVSHSSVRSSEENAI